MEYVVCKSWTYLIYAFSSQKSLLWIRRIHKQMNMGMMSCVMKSGIPFQIAKRNTLCFCNVGNMPFHKFSPHFWIIIAETHSVFSPKWNNMRPYIAFVISYFVCNSVKNDRFVFFIKQTVRTSFLNSWTHSHVAYKVLPISDNVGIAFNYHTD